MGQPLRLDMALGRGGSTSSSIGGLPFKSELPFAS